MSCEYYRSQSAVTFAEEERVRSASRWVICEGWRERQADSGGVERIDYVNNANVAFRRGNEEAREEESGDEEGG